MKYTKVSQFQRDQHLPLPLLISHPDHLLDSPTSLISHSLPRHWCPLLSFHKILVHYSHPKWQMPLLSISRTCFLSRIFQPTIYSNLNPDLIQGLTIVQCLRSSSKSLRVRLLDLVMVLIRILLPLGLNNLLVYLLWVEFPSFKASPSQISSSLILSN